MAVSSEDVTRIILECAREEKFDRHEITEESCNRAGYKYPHKVVSMVAALITSGALAVTDSGVVKVGTAQGPTYNSEDDPLIKNLREQLRKEQATSADLRRKVVDAVKAADEGIKAANDRAEKAKGQTKIVEVQLKDGKKVVKSVKGVFHAKFERILQLARQRKNIFLYGPTGCGKTHICAQLAEALNLEFYFVSCTTGMSEGSLAGRLLPVGDRGTFEYVIGEFVKAYEQGGVFLLDEMDAADPNVLLIINSALSNGRMAVPNRPKKPYAMKHKDFICIAAANTVGTGADRLYSGRNKLDAATLDRFQVGKVFLDYDPAIEAELCPDVNLRERLLKYREKVRKNRLERSVSTRMLKDAYDMMQEEGWTVDDVDNALFEGWRQDERNKATMN